MSDCSDKWKDITVEGKLTLCIHNHTYHTIYKSYISKNHCKIKFFDIMQVNHCIKATITQAVSCVMYRDTWSAGKNEVMV